MSMQELWPEVSDPTFKSIISRLFVSSSFFMGSSSSGVSCPVFVASLSGPLLFSVAVAE
jgi:hypothetical protein